MHWLIVCRDRPNVEDRRRETRAAHRAYIWRDDLPARMLTGSPLSDDTGERMTGSWLLVEAADRAAVEAFAASDPYRLADLFETVEIFGVFNGYDASVILPPEHLRTQQRDRHD